MRYFMTRLLFVLLFVLGQLLVTETGLAQQKQPKKTGTAKASTKTAPTKTAPSKDAAAKSAAPRANAALAVVPDNVLGFAVIRSLGELDEKIGGLARTMQIPAPPALMTLQSLTGVQAGLDEKGAVVIAVIPANENDARPTPLLFVPVSDYQQFIAQLQPGAKTGDEPTDVTIADKNFAVVKKGDYAVLTEPTQRDRLKDIVAAKGGSLGLASSLTTWIGEHDAYFVIMPEAIKRGIAPMRQGLQEAKRAFADNEQLKNVGMMFDVYDDVLSTVENEVTHFAVGLRIQDGAVFINSHSVFLPTGSLAQAAKDAKRPDESGLASLPAGPYMMAFEGVFPESWSKGMMKFSVQAMQMMGGGGEKQLSDEDVRKLTETMQKSMAGVKSVAFRVGPMEPGKSMYDNMSGIMKVDDSAQYLADYEAGAREMAKLFEDRKIAVFKSYEISKSKVDGVATLQLTMDMSGMLESATLPQQRQMMELMMGKGGKMTAYMAPADATTVVMAYSKEGLSETLKGAKNQAESLARQEDVAKTMKLLPREAQWMAFISPKGMVDFAQTMVQSFAPGAPGQLPPFPETSPVGFGARMTTQGCETSLVVPNDVLEGIGSYIRMMQQNIGPGVQPGVNGVPQRQRRR